MLEPDPLVAQIEELPFEAQRAIAIRSLLRIRPLLPINGQVDTALKLLIKQSIHGMTSLTPEEANAITDGWTQVSNSVQDGSHSTMPPLFASVVHAYYDGLSSNSEYKDNAYSGLVHEGWTICEDAVRTVAPALVGVVRSSIASDIDCIGVRPSQAFYERDLWATNNGQMNEVMTRCVQLNETLWKQK